MRFFFREPTIIEKRRKQLNRELAQVEDHLRTLSRRVRQAGFDPEVTDAVFPVGLVGPARPLPPSGGGQSPAPRAAPLKPFVEKAKASPTAGAENGGSGEPAPPGVKRADTLPPPEEVSRFVREQGKRIRDERFTDYLSTSFSPHRPPRFERGVQRNKAIAMVIFALLLLLWILFRFVF